MMTDYELKLDRKVRDLSSKERDILVADLQKTVDIDYKFNELGFRGDDLKTYKSPPKLY